MKKEAEKGFEYFVDDEKIKEYRKKPLELRLRWLYAGNLLRKECGRRVKERHDEFRGD